MGNRSVMLRDSTVHVTRAEGYAPGTFGKTVNRAARPTALARSGEIFDNRAAALVLKSSQVAFRDADSKMKPLLWFFPWILLKIVLTSGSYTDEEDGQSKMICCTVGRGLAESHNNCNLASTKHSRFPGISPEICEGYMGQCCREKLKEKECGIGSEYALSNRACQDLRSMISENCCTTCQTALSSTTCHAEWLRGEAMLSKVFTKCCEIGKSGTQYYQRITDVVRIKLPITPVPRCPKGYKYDHKSRVCKDINECISEENVCPEESRCVNKEGGYECTKTPPCGAGQMFSHHVQDCVDIDECASNQHDCDTTQVCLNHDGGFKCQRSSKSNCGLGYVFEAGVGCVDEDECAVAHACSPEEECVNRGSHYICVTPCKPGFRVDPITVECIDIDECAMNTHNCKNTQECFNTEGSFECRESNLADTCSRGFQRSANGECKDIDECASNSHNCPASQKCKNLEGSFLCIEQCEKGFALNGAGRCEDIDECLTDSPCDESTEVCENTRGGYFCKCKPGYEKVGSLCSDIDECKRSGKPCGEQAACVNTLGSFSCFANCGDGYRHVNGSCIDNNECEEFTATCLNGQECVNLPGTYKCVDKDCELLGKVRGPDGTCLLKRSCLLGFRHDLESDTCVDRDECVENYPSACPGNSFCKNTMGSFNCIPNIVRCTEGMRRSLDGTRCENVDECSEGLHTCDLNSEVCLDRTGSFDCVCKESFEKDGSGKCVSSDSLKCGVGYRQATHGGACQDINECNNPGICEHECRNKMGSYVCLCKAGFEPDKRNKAKCVDINECKRPGVCPGLCENTHGSFKCRCPEGYEMKRNSCVDIDECAVLGEHNCRDSETCLNVGGGFRCLSHGCPTNYTADSSKAMRCSRNQPCADQAHCSLDPDLIIFNHVPLSRSSSKRALAVRVSGQRNVLAEFSLHVTRVVAGKIGLTEATDENFLLKARQTAAKVYVRKRITGPQDVYMTLKAKLYNVRDGPPVGTELFKIVEWRIVLYVPVYDF